MKNSLRKKYKELRKTLDLPMVSRIAVSLIKGSEIYKNAKNVMLYYPIKYEIDLLDLLGDNKNFYFPKVNGLEIVACPYVIGQKLEKSKMNILEPCSNPVNPDILDLVVVPAIVVDKQGYRIGYGGGYYDRFLKTIKPKTLCVIPDSLYIENIYPEIYDVKIDEVLIVTNS